MHKSTFLPSITSVTLSGTGFQPSYHAFGSIMPGYSYKHDSADGYRYGFNNQEKEIVLGDYYSFEYRIYDARLGRFQVLDPHSFKYPNESNYIFCHLNPIIYIDVKGLDPIDPRTGKKIEIDYWRHDIAVSEFSIPFIPQVDPVILKNAPPSISSSPTGTDRQRGAPDGIWSGGLFNKHKEAVEETSNEQRILINSLLPKQKDLFSGGDERFGGYKGALPAWMKAGSNGSYVFFDRYSESEFWHIDVDEYNIYTVEQNSITQIINMMRDEKNDKFNVNTVTRFSIADRLKGVEITPHKFLWFKWNTAKSYEQYKLTTETTAYNKKGEATGCTQTTSTVIVYDQNK